MNLGAYFAKMRGSARGGPPRVSAGEIALSWGGAFLGVAVLAWADRLFLDRFDLALMIGSFGASAVLLFGAVRSPLAQPRNVLGGHILSAAIGVACWKLLHPAPWLAEAAAVAFALAVMHATRTLHPPGGATALIAVIGSPQIHDLGFGYVAFPVATGAIILVVTALIVNNIPKTRRYPEMWF